MDGRSTLVKKPEQTRHMAIRCAQGAEPARSYVHHRTGPSSIMRTAAPDGRDFRQTNVQPQSVLCFSMTILVYTDTCTRSRPGHVLLGLGQDGTTYFTLVYPRSARCGANPVTVSRSTFHE